jgi:hypothetical protein
MKIPCFIVFDCSGGTIEDIRIVHTTDDALDAFKIMIGMDYNDYERCRKMGLPMPELDAIHNEDRDAHIWPTVLEVDNYEILDIAVKEIGCKHDWSW